MSDAHEFLDQWLASIEADNRRLRREYFGWTMVRLILAVGIPVAVLAAIWI